jgi:hypothetical protein
MASYWKRLTSLLPVPESPRGLDTDWESIEHELGIVLPSDYKQFINHFGTGLIQGSSLDYGCLSVWNYREASNNFSLLDDVSSVISEYHDAREKGYSLIYPFYPEKGGLLPFASTQNGDYFNWRMVGISEKWDVVFYDSSRVEMVLFKGKRFMPVLVGLLEQTSPLLTERIATDCFTPPYHFGDVNW